MDFLFLVIDPSSSPSFPHYLDLDGLGREAFMGFPIVVNFHNVGNIYDILYRLEGTKERVVKTEVPIRLCPLAWISSS